MPPQRPRRPRTGSTTPPAAQPQTTTGGLVPWDPNAPTPEAAPETLAEGRAGSGIDPNLIAAQEQFTAEKIPFPIAPQNVTLIAPPEGVPAGVLGRENLVATGIGEEYQGGSPTGRMAIKVYVRRKVTDENQIDSDAFIDKVYRFNGQDYPVDVEELTSVYLLNFWGFESPKVKGGGSIGNLRTRHTGTFGCLVALHDDKICILSNNHVIAASNAGLVNQDRIIHPGPVFPHPSAYQVGLLLKFQQLFFDGRLNTVDAAVAWTRQEVAHFGHHNYTLSPTTASAFPGMVVKKEGAATGPTTGIVRGILLMPLSVPYGPGNGPPFGYFHRQILIEGTDGPNRPFSTNGDSGSLVVTRDTNQPVGLLFAGGQSRDGRNYTIANPIDEVRSALGIARFVNKVEPVIG